MDSYFKSCQNDSCCSADASGKDFLISPDHCEVQVDIVTDRIRSVVIWGHVKDCRGHPINHALVKLLKYEIGCRRELREVCDTCTDCQGYYQFDLPCNSWGKYRIVVSKSDCDMEPCCPPPPPCACQCQESCDYIRDLNYLTDCDSSDCQRSRRSCHKPHPPQYDCCGTKTNKICYY